jgi:aldehyde:ferredoxin oxidoreductase
LINNLDGIYRDKDVLPPRFHEKREDTGWRIAPEDFERMIEMYYRYRRWSERGAPTIGLLKELELIS